MIVLEPECDPVQEKQLIGNYQERGENVSLGHLISQQVS